MQGHASFNAWKVICQRYASVHQVHNNTCYFIITDVDALGQEQGKAMQETHMTRLPRENNETRWYMKGTNTLKIITI